MADYCTIDDVKALAGTQSLGDDDLLEDLVTRSSRVVDSHTRRVFVKVSETRYFTPGADTKGQLLFVDTDLLSVSELKTDAEVIPDTDYTLFPLNISPKNRVQLGSNYSWEYPEDPAGSIQVTGDWGYSATAPADIVQATARLALWMYRQREAPFGKMGNAITGEYEVQVALPEDVEALLMRYRRVVWGAF